MTRAAASPHANPAATTRMPTNAATLLKKEAKLTAVSARGASPSIASAMGGLVR